MRLFYLGWPIARKCLRNSPWPHQIRRFWNHAAKHRREASHEFKLADGAAGRSVDSVHRVHRDTRIENISEAFGETLWQGSYSGHLHRRSRPRNETPPTRQIGQVILSEIWGKKGAIGFVPQEGQGALCTSHFFLFDVCHRGLPNWLEYIFRANYLQEQLDLEAKGTTGYAAVRPAHLLKAMIPLPPLEEQRRLVERIDALVAKIEEAKGLREKASRELGILGEQIPMNSDNQNDWPLFSMEQIVGRVNLKNGKSLKATSLPSNIRCLTLSSMRGGKIDTAESKPVPMSLNEAKPYLVRPGDVFVVRGNGSKHLVGRAGYVENIDQLVIYPDLFIKIPIHEETILPKYFVTIWNSRQIRSQIEDSAKTTSGIWKINQGHIVSIAILVPPIAEQSSIVDQVEAVEKKCHAAKSIQSITSQELDAMLPAILDRAFRGEL